MTMNTLGMCWEMDFSEHKISPTLSAAKARYERVACFECWASKEENKAFWTNTSLVYNLCFIAATYNTKNYFMHNESDWNIIFIPILKQKLNLNLPMLINNLQWKCLQYSSCGDWCKKTFYSMSPNWLRTTLLVLQKKKKNNNIQIGKQNKKITFLIYLQY